MSKKREIEYRNNEFDYGDGVLVYYGKVFDLTDSCLLKYAKKTNKLILKDTVKDIKYGREIGFSYDCKVLGIYFPSLTSLVISTGIVGNFDFKSCSNLKRLTIRGNNTSVYGLLEVDPIKFRNPVENMRINVPVDYQYKNELAQAHSVAFCYDGSRKLEFIDKENVHVQYGTNTKYYLAFSNSEKLITCIRNGDFLGIIEHFNRLIKNGTLKSNFKWTIVNRKTKDDNTMFDLLNQLYESCEYSMALFGKLIQLGLSSKSLGSLILVDKLKALISMMENETFINFIKQIYSTLPVTSLSYIKRPDDMKPYTTGQKDIGTLYFSESIDSREKNIIEGRLCEICDKYFLELFDVFYSDDKNFYVDIFIKFLEEINKLYSETELGIATKRLTEELNNMKLGTTK